MKPTIKNIAKAAGVSTATVSRALANKDQLLRPATSARIRKIAHEMGYHKNVAASQLASKITKTIAVIINYTQTNFWKKSSMEFFSRPTNLATKSLFFLPEKMTRPALPRRLTKPWSTKPVGSSLSRVKLRPTRSPS